ncbi:conserved Plasmodium protein, unknown function [Plasmodium gallinaceum]|uniref:RNA-editing substrate-binding complex 6 protein domain-containing protein n=1 Tax=Plasmodium gallinaceum TaxID=5849 RepID=A0A1J1GPE0_PLAGA|nr:conserved Plasmodium protein, unknown function [Plasmodium gallinaceum]CRG94174.1 conserved Plasmodium protein, unknown function [Plasmodium gallinaceum]
MLKFKNVLKQGTNVIIINNYFYKRYLSKINSKILYKYNSEDYITNDRRIKINDMNSSVLCIFSNMLLKENIKNDLIWKKIEKRSYELIDKFEVNDIASFLFCLSKVRYETNLFESFIPIIKIKCEYFNTSNLAMLISAYSKRKKEDLIILLKEELKKKVHTLHNMVEISMILNALVKCKINDEDLFSKMSNIIIDNVVYNNVHVRDICVITYCYAYILYKNMNIFKILSQKIIILMDDVNLVDLCRVLYSYMRINRNFNHILKLSAFKLENIIEKSSISDVINCIHFLPILKQIVEKHEYNDINCEIIDENEFNYFINYFNLFNYIVNVFNGKLISYTNILNSNQISNIFYMYSRYNILMRLSELEVFIYKIKNMILTNDLKIYILYSLTLLLKNYENNTIYDFNFLNVNKIFVKKTENLNEKFKKENIKCVNKLDYNKLKNNLVSCLKEWENDINLFINNYDVCLTQDVIKVLNICLILNYTHDSILNNIKHYIIFNYKNINEHNAYTLIFYFQKLNKLNEDEDFYEILKNKIKSLK